MGLSKYHKDNGWTGAPIEVGQDPIAVAAQEMEATTAVFAQHKVALAQAGLGGLMGGGAPSAEAMTQAVSGDQVMKSNPHAHLTRDEKIALLAKLAKSRQPAQPVEVNEDPSELVDPLLELSVAPSPSQEPTGRQVLEKSLGDLGKAQDEASIRAAYDGLSKAVYSEADKYRGTCCETEALEKTIAYKKAVLTARKARPAAKPSGGDPFYAEMDSLREKYFNDMDALEIKVLEDQKKQSEKAMSKSLDEDLPDEEVSALDFLQDLLEKSEGEGSRGGKVIGHTASGKPIYKPSDDHIARVREHVNLQKKTAKGKLDEHADSHVNEHGKGYDAEDHKHASEHHSKEAKNFKNSDKVRAFHQAIADAHGAKAGGKETPFAAADAKAAKAYENRVAKAKKKEAERPKVTVAKTEGGHEIKNTHHVRDSAAGTSIETGPASSAKHIKPTDNNSPIETEWGDHLTADKHKDIAKYHRDQAHKHAAAHDQAGGHNLGPGLGRLGTKDSTQMRMHEYAAAKHEAEAKKKSAPSEKQMDLTLKSVSSSEDAVFQDLLEKASEGEGSRGGKVIGHTASGKPIYETPGHLSRKQKENRIAGKLPAQNKKGSGANRSIMITGGMAGATGLESYSVHKLSEMSDEHIDKLHDHLHKSIEREDDMNANDILNDFLEKSEGQCGMPEAGDPPQAMPTKRRKVDGGDLEGEGAPSGAQSPAPSTVASTSNAPSVPEEDLREKTPKDEELDDEGKLKKGNWVDWNEAADTGERLRAQLTSQLMNKSLDVTYGVGVRSQPRAPAPVQELPSVYFQKGGSVLYVDSEDRRIEKALERVGGQLSFSHNQQVNFGSAAQHDTSCPTCDSMVKSYLSSCTECGSPLHARALPEGQGLRIEKSVAQSLVPTAEDDVLIG